MNDQCDSARCGIRLPLLVRWTARAGSLVSVGFIVAFIIGRRANPFQMQSTDLLLFLCFPTAVAVGILLAWRWEFVGGILALSGLTAFYVSNHILAGSYPKGWAFAAFTAPAVLFLASALLTRLAVRKGVPSPAGAP